MRLRSFSVMGMLLAGLFLLAGVCPLTVPFQSGESPDAAALTAAAQSLLQTQVALEQTVQAMTQAVPIQPTPVATAVPAPTMPAPTPLPPTASLPTATPVSPTPTVAPAGEMSGVPGNARGNLFCRSGPAPYYPSVGLVPRGSSVTVVGRNKTADPDYWLLRLEDGTLCWVWGRWLEVQGDVAILPVPTAPPPPPGAFSIGVRKTATCGGQHAVVFAVTNRGPKALESIYIKVRVRGSGDVYENPPFQRNQFVRCGGALEKLDPGKTTEVWVITGASDLSGKTLEVTAKACTGNDFTDACVERTPFIVVAP